MIGRRLILVGLLLSGAPSPALASTVPQGHEPLLLDGRCDGEEYKGSASVDLGHGVTMKVIRVGSQLGLCIPLRPGSLGTLDLFLVTPRQRQPLNLHVSAQIGERQLIGGRWPEWAFWNHRAWAAPWVPFEGFDGEGAERRPRWGTGAARELVLDTRRFGEGRWLFRVELRRVMDPASVGSAAPTEIAQLIHPVGTIAENEAGWDSLDLVPETPLISATPGAPNAVGFRAVDLVDWSRWREPRRPDTVRAFVWYPASVEEASDNLSLGLLAGLVSSPSKSGPASASEDAGWEVRPQGTFAADVEEVRAVLGRHGRPIGEATAREFLAQPTRAVAGASPLSGAGPASLPLVLVASSLPPWAHDALAERLALAGLVVAQVEPAAARDLSLVILELPRLFPVANPRRVALIGYGVAGVEATLFARQHAGLAAVVSLDGAEGWPSGAERLVVHPEYRPLDVRAPQLRVVAAGRKTDRRYLDAATGLRGWQIEVPGLRPADSIPALELSSLERRLRVGLDPPDIELAEAIESNVASFLADCFRRPGASLLTWRPDHLPRGWIFHSLDSLRPRGDAPP